MCDPYEKPQEIVSVSNYGDNMADKLNGRCPKCFKGALMEREGNKAEGLVTCNKCEHQTPRWLWKPANTAI